MTSNSIKKNVMKSTKFSVAVLLINPDNDKEFLVVKRPPDDDRLPNVWGLPAVTIQSNELPENTVKRIGIEKLDTDIEATEYIGIKRSDRDDYELILIDIKAKLTGKQPSVEKAQTENTKYVDQQWTSDLNILKDAASKGSLCSQIVLDASSIDY